MQNYKDLKVWHTAIDVITGVYGFTQNFPKEEIYNLTSQMRRSAVAIPSNIAEGRRRGGDKEFRYFLSIAFDSGAELETQIEIANRLFPDIKIPNDLNDNLSSTMKMLNKLLSKAFIKN